MPSRMVLGEPYHDFGDWATWLFPMSLSPAGIGRMDGVVISLSRHEIAISTTQQKALMD